MTKKKWADPGRLSLGFALVALLLVAAAVVFWESYLWRLHSDHEKVMRIDPHAKHGIPGHRDAFMVWDSLFWLGFLCAILSLALGLDGLGHRSRSKRAATIGISASCLIAIISLIVARFYNLLPPRW